MPYNVLFPFKNESDLKDFAATGNAEIGWIETDPNDEKILDKMARCMSGSGADLDDRDSAIMSIPSPIAVAKPPLKASPAPVVSATGT